MRTKCLIFLGLLSVIPTWAQVQPSASGTPPEVYDDEKMSIPPPVSGQAYPDATGGEARSNYISGKILFEAAYDDNLYVGTLTKPVSDTTYTILPTISYDRTEPKQKQSFTYSPGFTFYEPTTALNAIDQSAKAGYTYRFSPYTAVSLDDTFYQTSSLLGQTGTLGAGGVTGSSGSAGQPLLIPFADVISNNLRGSAEKQFARNQMAGASGNFSLMDFPDPKEAPGVFNSKTFGGTGFYAQRFSLKNYLGVFFDYTHIAAYPPLTTSTAQVEDVMPYFTLYFNRSTSISVAAGPQHYSVSLTGGPDQSAWTPSIAASAGWQRARTNLNVAYSRSVTGGGGLLGAYQGSSGAIAGRLQISHSWICGVDFDYQDLKNVSPAISNATPGGHSVGGDALVRRTLGEHFGLEFGYDRLHQSYSGIAVLANDPNSDRGYGSIFYQFQKPLGK